MKKRRNQTPIAIPNLKNKETPPACQGNGVSKVEKGFQSGDWHSIKNRIFKINRGHNPPFSGGDVA